MKRIALAAALAVLASPAFAGGPYGTNVDLGAQLGFMNDIEITVQTTCGTLGMSSTGGCRRGIFGLADYNAHGTCWIDRRSGRPTCDK
jgi:hypothetical protein